MRAALDGDAIALEAFEEWFAAADAGDAIVYAWGAVLRRDRAAVARAAELADERELRLHLARRDGRIEYLARRIDPPREVSVGAVAVTARGETVEDRVFHAIRRRCRFALPMATDAELARECGLRDADQAAYMLRKLKADPGYRRIRVENFGPGQRRVATIVAPGAATVRGPL
jgi:hypothetical protein